LIKSELDLRIGGNSDWVWC